MGGLRRLSEIANERLRYLNRADMSLIAYQLPLDAHPEVGNNVALSAELDLIVEGPIGEGCVGVIAYDRAGTRYLGRERGVELHAPGHYNIEKLGVQRLGAPLARRFGL